MNLPQRDERPSQPQAGESKTAPVEATRVTHREPHLSPSSTARGYQEGNLTRQQPRPSNGGR